MIRIVATVLVCVVLTIPAVAKPNYHYRYIDRHAHEFSAPASWHPTRSKAFRKAKAKRSISKARKPKLAIHRKASQRQTRIAPIVQPHPEGCPRTRFCGCGASLKIFGKRIPKLYLARNWLKFPKAKPGPMKVAVRPGHIFVILKDLGGNKVLAYDANTKGRKTLIHVRNLAGFSVRDPGGSVLAETSPM